MVRLKGGVDARTFKDKAFQFHYGTIKRIDGINIEVKTVAEFQFHYGTIKSRSTIF